ncbi:MAG TPA: multiheme c-type cytochrome [Verrucomicrobiae bacterium]|nr:multiheme c-type cytochrome [Verrucomicrobiae bacterium]
MIFEWLTVVLFLAGAGWLAFGRNSGAPRWAAAVFLAGSLASVGLWQRQLQGREASRAGLTTPRQDRAPEYTSSTACRACHPSQYQSWHHSYHRTMTQKATPEAVRGDFENVSLELDGSQYLLQRKGDEFWVEMPDPEALMHPNATNAPAGQVRRRVTMVTGSHHMQAYWVENQHGNQQYSLPFTYIFETGRWVPRRSVFMQDPKKRSWNQLWNVGCVDCHSTAGQPRLTGGEADFDTRVAELGIACEACHGPGAEHVRLNSDPRRRYGLHFKDKGDPSIVNPARLDSKRSAEVCGACHSIHFAPDQGEWLKQGIGFRPGEALETRTHVPPLPKSQEVRKGSFWGDGMVRVSGREYNGLLKTACYLQGQMSCLSCHSMHDSSPTNQVARGMEGNQACFQCHQDYAKDVSRHTHHAAGSSGSLCYNCHMPYTTYGLLKALRSHQISNPSVETGRQTGRPNACNLCHLDKTLAWAGQKLQDWYRQPLPQDLAAEEKAVAASVLWTLKGDAGQRALMAWHMGWQPAKEASRAISPAPYLATLLDDPYAVVRYIAGRSLLRLPEFSRFTYDYLAPVETLHQFRDEVVDLWTKTARPGADAALLLGPDGHLDIPAAAALLQTRNNRLVELHE